jgi:TPR repeat protein
MSEPNIPWGSYMKRVAGVKKNRESAIYWYSAAAKQGHKNAEKRLQKLQSGTHEAVSIDTELAPQEALLLAVDAGDIKVAEKLLAQGVSAQTRDRHQRPVLLDAVTQKDSAMVKLLIKYGADVNVG